VVNFRRLELRVEAVGVEPTGVSFADPASNLAAPTSFFEADANLGDQPRLRRVVELRCGC
jgi:hypothetical protein